MRIYNVLLFCILFTLIALIISSCSMQNKGVDVSNQNTPTPTPTLPTTMQNTVSPNLSPSVPFSPPSSKVVIPPSNIPHQSAIPSNSISVSTEKPYPTSLPVPPPAYKIVAQKKIEKVPSRVLFKISVIGNIAGKDYLFVGVNPSDPETLTNKSLPGILIFDIQNPVDPKEISYLSAPEGIQNINDLKLAGNLLYASVRTPLDSKCN